MHRSEKKKHPSPSVPLVRPDPQVKKAGEGGKGRSSGEGGKGWSSPGIRVRGLSSAAEEAGNRVPRELWMAGPPDTVPDIRGDTLPVPVSPESSGNGVSHPEPPLGSRVPDNPWWFAIVWVGTRDG